MTRDGCDEKPRNAGKGKIPEWGEGARTEGKESSSRQGGAPGSWPPEKKSLFWGVLAGGGGQGRGTAQKWGERKEASRA